MNLSIMKNTFSDSAPLRLSGKKNAWQFPHSDLTERIIGAAIHIARSSEQGVGHSLASSFRYCQTLVLPSNYYVAGTIIVYLT